MRLKKTPGQLSLILAFVFGSMATAMAHEYTLRITNLMDEELLAPILVTSVRMDKHIFNDGYVTPEAQEQILTGDPGCWSSALAAKRMLSMAVMALPGCCWCRANQLKLPSKDVGMAGCG